MTHDCQLCSWLTEKKKCQLDENVKPGHSAPEDCPLNKPIAAKRPKMDWSEKEAPK